MALTRDEFNKQYAEQRANGASARDAVNYIAQSAIAASSGGNRSKGTLSRSEFNKQYTAARQNGASSRDAINSIAQTWQPESWQDEDDDWATMETYEQNSQPNNQFNPQKDYSDAYEGKSWLQRALTRVGSTFGAGFSDIGSGLATTGAKLGTTLQNTLANIPIDEREQAVYQIARGQYWRSHDYSGEGKSSITPEEFDALDARGKNYLKQRFRIDNVDDFNKYLEQAYKDISAANRTASISEQQMQNALDTTQPMRDWAEEQREKAKFGLGDSFGDKTASFLLDTLSSAPGMAADAAFAAATGGSGLILMAGRVFGNAYNNAVAKGADDNKAGLYGIASAALETATEMIGGEALLNKLAYGNKGLLNTAIENTVAKLGKGKWAALWGMAAGSEAIEEIMSQAGEPFVEAILEDDYGKALAENYGEQTVKDYLLAGLGGALMAIGGNVAVDTGTGVVNTIRGAEGPRTATGQQLQMIDYKHNIETSPEAMAEYNKAIDEGASEYDALRRAGAIYDQQQNKGTPQQNRNLLDEQKKQRESEAEIKDFILSLNDMPKERSSDYTHAYDDFADNLNSAGRGDVLVDRNGNTIGVVKGTSGDGFVVSFEGSNDEAIFRSSTSGSLNDSGRVYNTLKAGGEFVPAEEAAKLQAENDARAKAAAAEAERLANMEPEQPPRAYPDRTVAENPQQMAAQEEITPEAPAEKSAPVVAEEQKEQPKAEPVAQPAPQPAQQTKYPVGKNTNADYKGMPVQIKPNKDGTITVKAAEPRKKGASFKKTYITIGTANSIDEANQMIVKHYNSIPGIQNKATPVPAPLRDNTSKVAPESPQNAPVNEGTSNRDNTSKASTEETRELVSKPSSIQNKLVSDFEKAMQSGDEKVLLSVRADIADRIEDLVNTGHEEYLDDDDLNELNALNEALGKINDELDKRNGTEKARELVEPAKKKSSGKRFMADLDSTTNELDGLSRVELQKELTKARAKLNKLMASANEYKKNGWQSAFSKEYGEISGLISEIQTRLRAIDEANREKKYPEREPSEYSKKQVKGLYREEGTRETIEYEGRDVITLTGKQLQSIDGDGKEIFDKGVHDYFDREKTLTPDQVGKMKPVQILQRLADWANDLRPLGRLSGFAKWYTDISSREDIDKGALGNLQQKFSDNVAEGEEDVDDSAYSFGSRGVEKQSVAAQAAAQKENKTFAAMWLYSSLQGFAHANTFGYGNTNLLDACDWLIEQYGKGRFDKKSAHRRLLDHVEKLVGKNVTDWSKASVQDALRLIGEKYPAIVEATEEEAFSLLPDDAKIEIDALLARAKTITLASDEEKAEIANDIAIDPDNPEAGLDEYERYRKKHGREAKTLFSVLDGDEAYSKDKTLQSRSEFDYWDEDMSDNEQEAGTEQLSLEQEEAIEDAIYEALKQRKGWLNESQFTHGELPYSTTMLFKEGSKADVGTDTMFNGDKASHDNFEGMKDRRGNQWVLKRGTGILRNLFRSNIAETLTAVYNEHQQTLKDMKRELREKVAKRDDLRRRYKGAEDLQGMSLPLKNVDAGKELSKEIKELEKQIDAEQKLLDRFDNKDYKKAQKVIEDLKKNGADKKTIDAAKKEAADVNYTLSRLYRDNAMTEKNIQDILNSLKGQEKDVGGFQIANLKGGMNARLAGEAINKALEESNEQERRRKPKTYTGALPGAGSNRPFLAGSDWQRARAAEESDEHRAAREAADAETAERLGKDEIWFEEQQQRASRFRAATEEQEQRTRYQNGEALSSGNTNGVNRNDGRNDAAVSGEPGRAGQEVGGAGKKLSPKKEAARKRNQAFADKINGAPEIKGFPMDARPGKAGKVSTVKDMGDHIYIEGEATAGITADDKKYSKTANTINNAFDEWGIAVAGVNGKIFKRRGAVQSIAGIFVPTANSVGRTTPIGGFVEGNSVCLRNISRSTVNKTVRGARHEIQHKITDHMFPGERHNDQMVEFAKKLVTDVGLDYDEATTKLRTVYEDLGITNEVLIADEVIARIADAEGFGTDADPRTPTEGTGKAYVTPEQADAMYSALINSTEWRSAVFNRSNTANTRALFFEDIPNSFYDISSEQSSPNRNYRLEKYTQLIEESIDARANGNADKADLLLNQARRLFSENVNHGWQLVQKEHKAELDRLVSEIERLAKTPRDIAATGEELDKLLSDIRELASNPRPSGYENLKSKYASEIKHGTARKGNEGLKNEPVYRVETGENLSKYETTSGISSGERLGIGKRFMADLDAGEGVPIEDLMADRSKGRISSEDWKDFFREAEDELNERSEGWPEPPPHMDEDTFKSKWTSEWHKADENGNVKHSNPFWVDGNEESEGGYFRNMGESKTTIERVADRLGRLTKRPKDFTGKRTAEQLEALSSLMQKVYDGDKSATEMYHMLENYRGKKGIGLIVDDYAVSLFQRLAYCEQYAYDEYGQITGGKPAFAYKFAADKAFGYLAAQAERARRIEYGDKVSLAEEAKKYGKGKPKNVFGEIGDWMTSMQMNPGNFFRMLGGYNKDGGTTAYKWKDRIDRQNSTRIQLQVECLSHFEEAKQAKDFTEFANGTAKGKYGSLLHEVALYKDLNRLVGTRFKKDKDGNRLKDAKGNYITEPDWSKVVQRDHFDLVDENDKVISSIAIEGESTKDREKFLNELFADLKADIKKSEAATKYIHGAESMFSRMSPILQRVSKSLGFDRNMEEFGKYFPLENADLDKNSNPYAWDIENELGVGVSGFKNMKSRYSDTYNIKVRPVSQVVDQYIQQSCNYAAYAELGADLKMLINADGDNGSLGDTINAQFGENFGRWLKNYTKDVNSITTEDPTGLNKILAKGRSLMQQGALLGSVSVPIKQISSYFSSMGVIDPVAVARAWSPLVRRSGNNIVDYMYKSRTQGSIDPDVSQALNSGWVEKLKKSGKLGAAVVNATNIMDSRTVANVYYACCLDVERNSGLTKAEIYKNGKNINDGLTNAGELLVHAKFTEAVLNTQPIFNKQARAEIARTSSEGLRMLSVFRTQQLQNYNRLLTTINEAKAAKNFGGDTKAANRELRQTISGQLAAAASISALTIIADMVLHKHKKYKDDDDDKFDGNKILETFGIKAVESIAGTHLFGNELAQIIIDKVSGGETNEFYGISMGAVSSAYGAMQSWGWLLDNYQKYGDKYLASNLKTAVGRTATMLGIPATNAYNVMNAFYQMYGDIAGKDAVSGYDNSKYDDFMKEWDAIRKDYGNKFYAAYKAGNEAKTQKAIDQMGDKFVTMIKNASLEQLRNGDATDDEVINALMTYADMFENQARDAVKTMHLQIDTGYTSLTGTGDKSVKTAWSKGDLSDKEVAGLYKKYSSKTDDSIKETVEGWKKDAATQKKLGYNYDELDDAYNDNKISRSDYKNALIHIGGKTADQAELSISHAEFKHAYPGHSYTDINKMYLNDQMSRSEAIKWHKKTNDTTEEATDNWIERLDFQKLTGYEANWRSTSDLYDTYSTGEKMGLMSFYKKYKNKFSSAKSFGKIFNTLNNVDKTDWPTYRTKGSRKNPNGYEVTINQARVITQMNKLIKSGELSYSMAHTIWTKVYGWQDHDYSAWPNVKKR